MSTTIFDESDNVYDCFVCGKKLRCSSKLKCVIELDSNVQHICYPSITKRNQDNDIGLESMQMERKAQAELYGSFHNAAKFKTNNLLREKQKQTARQSIVTKDHKNNISNTLHNHYKPRIAQRNNNIIELIRKGICDKYEIAVRLNCSYASITKACRKLKEAGLITN